MSQSCNLNAFSKLLSHFSLFDSQFFAAPFAIHDCCLSCRRVALSDIFGLWQSRRVSISSRNIICALSQPMAAACAFATWVLAESYPTRRLRTNPAVIISMGKTDELSMRLLTWRAATKLC
jgi:hypothetical protein